MAKGLRIAVPVVALALAAGCERKARTDQPRSYAKDGIRFQYPGNWEVTEDVETEGFRHLFVETPGDAILIVQVYAASDAMGLEDFARQFARTATEKTPFGKVGASTFGRVEESDGYESLTERLSISALGQRVRHTRVYRRRQFGRKVCFLIAQVADENHDKVAGGFDQIFASFTCEAP